MPHTTLVDLNETPVIEFTENGIRTSERGFYFDYIVCATGFDAITGGLLQMNVVGRDGISLNEKWKDGVKTYLGLCASGFPDMFFPYGPQVSRVAGNRLMSEECPLTFFSFF
jgi:cation diffusion facilitator CzcD-associated flavoprotein CzcO